MDFTLYKAINTFTAQHDWSEDLASVYAQAIPIVLALVLAAIFLLPGSLASLSGRRAAVAAGFSALVGLGIAHVITLVWDRPRPYVAHPGNFHLLIPASHDPSFPSDHATAAFAIAVSIFLRHRRAGWIALLLATLLSISRVAVGVHYPGDVLGGAALGTLAALLLWTPAIRRPVHFAADWAGQLYDHLVARGLRRPSQTPAG
jgi:undecaprenyl-diphosphatase